MRSKTRRGFTLPEVLVTIAIVATLAAVLLPALNSQLSKGDAGRLTSDLVAIQTAVGAFTSDVRRYPLDLEDLLAKPTAEELDLLSNGFGTVLINKWRGPYLSKELSSGNLPTGYGATISGTFTKTLYNTIQYLTITISPMTPTEFDNIDQIIDDSANSSTGQLRFAGNATSGTATFYAVPIQ